MGASTICTKGEKKAISYLLMVVMKMEEDVRDGVKHDNKRVEDKGERYEYDEYVYKYTVYECLHYCNTYQSLNEDMEK